MPPAGKAKKPAQSGKKEEKGEAKKPLQEKKAENAPAKAKKEGATKQAGAPPKKKEPAAKPAAGADANKGKDKGKKRKLNETQGKGKQGAVTTDSKKKKVEKKVLAKSGAATQKTRVGKKPIKKTTSKVTTPKKPKHRPARRGRQQIVVYEGRRYLLLPSGRLRSMLDFKLEENDKIAKVDGRFIKKSDVKAVEEFKETIKNDPPSVVKRKLKNKLMVLKRKLMKDMLKEARITKKPALATAKDAGREVKVVTMFQGTWVRRRVVPRMLNRIHDKTIKIKEVRKEPGPKELTEAEQKILKRYTNKMLETERYKLRHALLCKSASAARKKPAKSQKKPAKKAAPAKGKAAASKAGGDSKKQKRPAKKAAS